VRILLLNQDWWANELRELGHEVMSCGDFPHLDAKPIIPYPHINTLIEHLPHKFSPDVIIWLDNSAPLFLQGLEDCDIPIVLYSVDTHHHSFLHSHLASCVDHVLVGQKDYISHFANCGTPISWLPAWASREMEASTEKKYGATFVGTLNPKLNPKRVAFFEALSKIVPITFQTGDFSQIFPYSEIVINQTVKLDLNFRVFEAMASGALLLTEKTGNGLFDLFQDDHHFITYTHDDPKEAAEKIEWALAHPQIMREIGHNGRSEVLKKHTCAHRALAVHEVITNVKKLSRRPDRHYGAMINHSIVTNLTQAKTGVYPISPLVAAIQSASTALEEGIEPNPFHSAFLIQIVTAYDRMVTTSSGINLLKRFAAAFPDAHLIQLAEIRHLLNSGGVAEATSKAQKLSSSPPERVFRTAEEVITDILSPCIEGDRDTPA
jgi:hypothetical protein